MNGLSVIIPSKTKDNLMACVGAIRAAGEACQIIVVEDGIEWPDQIELDRFRFIPGWLRFVSGVRPFIFARNMNIGIKAAGDDDVILLNDDALLETPMGFTALHEASKDYGMIAPVTNLAGNQAQIQRAPQYRSGVRVCGDCPGNSFPTLAYICVLIPRRTINQIGLLDERFGGTTAQGKRIYGYEDNDYSRRLHLAGMKIGIHDGVFVNHNKLQPTFRGKPEEMDMQAARKIYLDKWKTV